MRKLGFPAWIHWHVGVEEGLETAMEGVQLTGTRLNGADTRLHVSVKHPDQHMGSMPFVQTALTSMEEHHNAAASGVKDPEGYTYTSIGGTKSVRQTNAYRERLTWTIEVLAQKYMEAVEIAQAIRRYFGPRNHFTISWRDENYTADCELTDYDLLPAETGEGHTEFFMASWKLTLFIKSDLYDPDEYSKNIVDVNMDMVASDGTNDSDELTKNFS